jgi:hypothetical protein
LEHIIGIYSKKQNFKITLRHTGAKIAEDRKHQLLKSRAGNVSAELTRRGCYFIEEAAT